MSRDQDAGSGGRRSEVLRVLQDAAGPLSIAEIADRVGAHPNTVRFHLNTLVDTGRVEPAAPARTRPGRPPLLFRAVRRMDPTGPRRYRLLADILTASLAAAPDSRARAIEAGRVWGRQLAESGSGGDDVARPGTPIERLVSLLDDLGFAPESRAGGARVGLRHCPFLELAETSAPIVCSVHLGLMRGAMGAWDTSVTVDRLDAFAEPDLCLAHLSPVGTP